VAASQGADIHLACKCLVVVEQRSKAVITVTTGLSFAGVVFLLLPRVDSPPVAAAASDVARNRADADLLGLVRLAEAAPTTASTRPHAVTVTFEHGLLGIRAEGAPLADVLAAVTRSVGITFVGAADAREPMSVSAGPGPIPQVLSALLAGANYGYAFLSDPGQAGKAGPGRVILLKQAGTLQQPLVSPAASRRPPVPIPQDQAMPASVDAPGVRQQQVLDGLLAACKEQGCDTS
jgi:hypothetical protein